MALSIRATALDDGMIPHYGDEGVPAERVEACGRRENTERQRFLCGGADGTNL